MKRAVGFVVFIALLGAAIWIGLRSGSAEHTWSLRKDETRLIGSLSLGAGNELCWDLEIDRLPRALQLHYDDVGPHDPVALSFYEPPAAPQAEGCKILGREYASLLVSDAAEFYVDGHERDEERIPAMVAQLVDA